MKLPGVVARRIVWTYNKSVNSDYVEWNWHEQYIDFTDETYHGINAETQISTILVAPITLGEFHVESSLLSQIPLYDNFTDYNEKNLKEGWNIHSNDKQTKYSISKADKLAKKNKLSKNIKPFEAGMQKISYRILPPENSLEYTLIGIQKGNTLIATPDVGTTLIREGILTAEEFAKESGDSVKDGSFFGLAIGLLFIALGVGKMLFFRQ